MVSSWLLCCVPSSRKSRGPGITRPVLDIRESKLGSDREIGIQRPSINPSYYPHPDSSRRSEAPPPDPLRLEYSSRHQIQQGARLQERPGSPPVDGSLPQSDALNDVHRRPSSLLLGPDDDYYPLPPQPSSSPSFGLYEGPNPHIPELIPSDDSDILPPRGERRNRRPSTGTSLNDSDSYGSPEPHFSMRAMRSAPMPSRWLYISFDIGSALSTVAYCADTSPRNGEMASWPGSDENTNKIPTCLVYDASGAVQAWGLEAKNVVLEKDWVRCEWFKSFLGPSALPDGLHPSLPLGKDPITIVADFISCLLKHIRDQDTLDYSHSSIKVCFTVPGSWDIPQSILINKALDLATSLAGYSNPHFWYTGFKTMTKSEAAAIYCAYMDNFPVEEDRAFLICNAGAGTVELGGYIFLGRREHPMIAEACMRSGSNCGSLALDVRFRNLLRRLQKENGIDLDPPNLEHYMHAFAEFKLMYRGEGSGSDIVYFDCFDPSGNRAVGLVSDKLAISRESLHLHVFEPVISEVLDLIERQLENMRDPKAVDALFLVGGFSSNEYLFTSVQQTFRARIKTILRPEGADVAACRGAAQYANAFKSRYMSISSVTPIYSTFSTKSYILGVEIPAEPEDLRNQPAFTSVNRGNVRMCANRALYVARKGEAIVTREEIRLGFRKYSESYTDSLFTAMLYISDSAEPSRYTIGGGEMEEFCKIEVDLNYLPSFRENEGSEDPFHTDFEIGFILFDFEFNHVGVTGNLYDRGDLAAMISVYLL